MQFLMHEAQHSDASNTPDDKKLQIVNEIRTLLKAIDLSLDDKENAQPSQHDQQNSNLAHIQTRPSKFPGISQLLPHLYLCGAGVALPHVLDELGVNFVISAAPELPDTPLSTHTKPLYLRIPLLDRPDADLSHYFDEVADMIEGVHQHNGITLVHCVAGVSRSATLCLAYLMKHGNMSLRMAYEHVKAIRPQIRPNTGFFEQLRQYDLKLHGVSSVKMVFYASIQKEIPDVYEPEYRAMEEFYQRQRKVPKRS